jgi:hypothetical protein
MSRCLVWGIYFERSGVTGRVGPCVSEKPVVEMGSRSRHNIGSEHQIQPPFGSLIVDGVLALLYLS